MSYTGNKARPTLYNGIRMRSRLEAEFARHLDYVGAMPWQYEPEAYSGPDGTYLPDFVYMGWEFTEVKPANHTEWDATFRKMHVIIGTVKDARLVVVKPGAWNGNGYDEWHTVRKCFADKPCGAPWCPRTVIRCYRCDLAVGAPGLCGQCTQVEALFDLLDHYSKILGRILDRDGHSDPYRRLNQWVNTKLKLTYVQRRRDADPALIPAIISFIREKIAEFDIDVEAGDIDTQIEQRFAGPRECGRCHHGPTAEKMPAPDLCSSCWDSAFEVCWSCGANGISRNTVDDDGVIADPICESCWARMAAS